MSNRVDHLLIRPFEAHSHAEKMEIKRLGPHQPIDIVIMQHKPNTEKKHSNRTFVVSWFNKVKWLTVSESKKGLFCFPCVLFGNDSTWSRTGFYDLKHLSERIRRHECSSLHINNCLRLKLYGQVDGNGVDATRTATSTSGAATSDGGNNVYVKAELDATVFHQQQQQSTACPSTVDGIEALLLSDAMLAVAHCGGGGGVNHGIAAISERDYERHSAHVHRHNAEVDRKHCVLAKLIDCVLFCFTSGLPLKLFNKNLGVPSCGAQFANDQLQPIGTGAVVMYDRAGRSRSYVFSAIMHFMMTVDNQLADSLRGTKSFLTDTLHNELLDSMLQVYREALAREVSVTRYVAILMEDFTQLLGQGRTAIIIRYLTSDSQLVERLWGLLNVSQMDETAFADVIAKQFGCYNLETKLVAHAHNGVFASSTMTIKHRLQKLYPFACYVQSYIQPLTVILCNICSAIDPIRVFFANLSSFPAFFAASSRRANTLDDIGDGLRLSAHDDHLVATVFESRRVLLACFAAILESDNWDSESVHGASVLQDLLHSTRFSFFLKFFHLVIPFADIVHRKFMMSDLTEMSARNAVKNFTTAIEWIAVNEIDSISTTASVAAAIDDDSQNPSKMARLDDVDENWREAAREACNLMIADVVERFQYVSHLLAFQLVDTELFESYGIDFPEEKLRAAEDAFPKAISNRKLKVELQALYRNSSFKFPIGLMATLDAINKTDLRDDFSETCKLLEIAVTSPVATIESDRCLDTLQRTKTCLQRNVEDHDDVTAVSISAERLNATTVITVQADFIRTVPNFTEAVIDRFSAQEHRRDAFVHKMFSQPPNYRKSLPLPTLDKSCFATN